MSNQGINHIVIGGTLASKSRCVNRVLAVTPAAHRYCTVPQLHLVDADSSSVADCSDFCIHMVEQNSVWPLFTT